MSLCLGLGHHLNEERPAREVSRLDRFEQVAAVAFAIAGNKWLPDREIRFQVTPRNLNFGR